MKTTRLVATALFSITRILSLLYLVTAIYVVFIFLFTINTPPAWLPLGISDGHFEIYFPFTHTPFLLGDYTQSFIAIMILIMFGYGIFLWMLSNIFKTFKQEKLFTATGVKRLSVFYGTNFIVPILILIGFFIAKIEISDMLIITCLHFVIGIFAFFMAAIFKQGLLLQEEQDLTL
ncbi:MAG TPA: DUF2975 domain-containing protein [Ferruginibacter sp.]|nr:DUF2975 domain-containing protein [Ferruginibacter sp.]